MIPPRLIFLFSCFFVLIALVGAAPVASNDLVERIAEPQGGMGGYGKDWKREAQGFGGIGKDWRRDAAPAPQGFGGFGKDWKREAKP